MGIVLFLCVKWVSGDLGWIPLYTISVERDFTVSFKKEGWMVQVVPYLIFAHSKEVLNFYEKLGTKVTEWSEIFGRFKGPYVI